MQRNLIHVMTISWVNVWMDERRYSCLPIYCEKVSLQTIFDDDICFTITKHTTPRATIAAFQYIQRNEYVKTKYFAT